METTGKTAIVYCRTSTRGQKDEKTIDAQVTWAKDTIKHDGVKLVPYGPKRDGWVMDDGVSGSLLDGRAFKKLIGDIEAGLLKLDYLYVYSLSRLSREDRSSTDKKKRIASRIDAARIAGVLGAYDIQIRDESGMNDPNTIAYDVKTSVSTEEYRGIRKRTMRGKARVLANNAMATGGRPPYGYERVPITINGVTHRRNGTTYAEHPEEGQRLKRLMAWYIEGGVAHASRKAMEAKWEPPRRHKSNLWYPSTVQQILGNIPAYLGETNRSIDGQEYRVTYPALLDLKTYASIKKRMKERTLKHRTTLLSTGYVDCKCGAHVHGTRSASTQAMLVKCGKREADGSTRDSCGTIHEDVLASKLWELVVARLVQIKEHEKMTTNGKDPYGPQLESAKGKLAKIQGQIDLIVGLFAEGTIDKAALTKKNEEYREAKTAIQTEVERLERLRDSHTQKKLGEESVQARVQSLLNKVKGITLDGKRNVLRDLLGGERVIVTWGKVPSITLPAFGDLTPVTVRIDRDVTDQIHGLSRAVLEIYYDVKNEYTDDSHETL